MNDAQAERVLLAVQELAITVRDEGPEAVDAAARAVLKAAGDDPIAALIVAAATVPIDEPVDPWWQDGLPTIGPRQLRPCGTMAAYARHRANGEQPCAPCRAAHAAEKREARHAKNALRAAV